MFNQASENGFLVTEENNEIFKEHIYNMTTTTSKAVKNGGRNFRPHRQEYKDFILNYQAYFFNDRRPSNTGYSVALTIVVFTWHVLIFEFRWIDV